jgi:hypothetical protein
MSGRSAKLSPRMTKIVEGDPIQVGGRELAPLVRVTSRMQRRASVGGHGVSGGGWGFVLMQPVAIVDRSGAGEHPLRIRGRSERWVVWLLLVFLVPPLIAVLLIALSQRSADEAT